MAELVSALRERDAYMQAEIEAETTGGPVVLPSIDVYESNWGMTPMPFWALVSMVHRLNSWERRITCIVHPDAEGIVDSPQFGGIRTEQGPAGYVLQSGERISL